MEVQKDEVTKDLLGLSEDLNKRINDVSKFMVKGQQQSRKELEKTVNKHMKDQKQEINDKFTGLIMTKYGELDDKIADMEEN